MSATNTRTAMAGLGTTAGAVFLVPAAVMGVFATHGVSAQEVAAQRGEQPTLIEIVVTARKRNEGLQEVPMSISAIGEQEIARSGAQSLQELTVGVPSLSFRSSGLGRQKLSLRGISSSAGVAPTVGFYIDEAPLASSSSAANTSFQQTNVDPNLFDIDRVEILRGPQGTLYGSSSLGGTVRIITQQPKLAEFESRANAQFSSTKGGGSNWALNGSANLPIVPERLALRVTGTAIENDGYIDRLIGNFDVTGRIDGPGNEDVTLPDRTLPAGQTARRIEDVNTESIRSARAALRFQASDAVYIQPSVFWQRSTQDGKSSFDSLPGGREQRRAFDVSEPFEDEFALGNLTVGVDFDAVNLLSTTSYMDRDIANVEDFTDLMSYFFGYSQSPSDLPAQRRIDSTGQLWDLSGPPFPATIVPIAAHSSESVAIEDFTQEFRLTSTAGGPFEWIAGAYFKKFRSDAGYDFVLPGYSATFPAYDTILGGVFGDNFALVDTQTRYRELALFGEIGYSFGEHWKLTLGARWFDYRTDFVRTTQGLFFGRPTPATVQTSAGDDGINPKVLLSYSPREHVQLYATAARGYRPGATNSPIPAGRCDDDLAAIGRSDAPQVYGPDSIWNYELGIKSRLGGRVTANAAVYLIDWNDIQQRVTLPTCGSSYTDNVGKAQSRGVELEVELLLTDELHLSLGAAYNQAQFTQSVPLAGVRNGDTLTDAPKLSLNTSVEYTFGHSWQGTQFVRFDWAYLSSSLDTQAQTNLQTGARTAGIRRAAFDIADFRLGHSSDNWELALFVQNLFDEQAEFTKVDTLGQIYPTYLRVSTNRPRTIGLAVTRSF